MNIMNLMAKIFLKIPAINNKRNNNIEFSKKRKKKNKIYKQILKT